jgi:class 3 adenylate cyclase/tetratricopeptide (TPR) repeat protein
VTCPVCGTVAVPGARFCHSCGAALPAAAPPAAERRVVTVLFGDLSDFTAWSEEADPERVGAVTDRVLAALAGAVKTFGGHVDKLTGDGIMAVFGAPVAHEDDAERAVRAALSMQRAVRRVLDDERGGGAPLGLRVGLNTGEVVALVQAALEYTVIGDTVNTAARLADAAAVGTVYAGEDTAGATRHLASWRHLRPMRLKGKRSPVETYELLGLLDAPGTRSGPGDEAPFVGRETELARIGSRLQEAVDRGESRVLVLTGEAGLGKSRLAAEVERELPRLDLAGAHSATRTLSVHCAAFGERRRLAPLADLVRLAIGLPGDARTPLGRPQVEERLRRLVLRLSRTAPGAPPIATEQLLTLLGYGEGTESPADRAMLGPSQVGELPATGDLPAPGDGLVGEAIPVAVADLLSALAQESPLLLIVDDLHDATPDTLDALGVALSRLTGPVLVLLLGRPELVRTAGVLTRLADAEVGTLAPLRGADAARLLSSYLNTGRLPQSDEDRLLATAQGNPFYLAELVTLLTERGALVQAEEGVWRLTAGSLGGRLLSRDLAAVLAARIDTLPVDARSALRDAAVIGETVPASALAALGERRSARDPRPPQEVAANREHAIDELLSRRMLRRARDGFAFATPLMREATYAGIGKADLAERHAYLARWAAPLAQARDASEAARRRDATAAVGAPPSDAADDAFVADQAERAIHLADEVGLRTDSPVRTVAVLGVAALTRLARRSVATGEPAQAARYGERAIRLSPVELPPVDQLVQGRAQLELGRPAQSLALAEKVVANSGADQALHAWALLLAGRSHRLLGDQQRSYQLWLEALATADAAGVAGARAEAMRRLGMADFLGGRLADASTRFAASYQVAVEADDPRSQAWSLQNLAWVTVTRGDFAGADATLARAARLFAKLNDPVGRAWIRGTAAFVRLLAGRLTEARRLARVFLPFGERVGEHWATGTLRAVEAFAAAEMGELAEADRQAREAYKGFAVTSDDWGRGFSLVARGAVARGLGSDEHAFDLLTDALGYGERAGHPLLIGMAGTMRGFVRLEMGDVDGARADAEHVAKVVETHLALAPAQVGPRVLLGAARLAAGHPEEAIDLLAPIAEAPEGVALLFPRRQGVALYARALRTAGRLPEALDAARRAAGMPGEDVRSRVIALRELAICLADSGDCETAMKTAQQAVAAAYATPQVAERAASDALVKRLRVPDPIG